MSRRTNLIKGAYPRHWSHGQARTRLYRVWTALKQRCHNPRSTSYKDYGGRGIIVCDSWRASFEAFVADVGDDPGKGFEIDRIDNSKGYGPDNWRWASRSQQMANTRGNRRIEFNGRTQTITEWSKELDIKTNTLINRLKKWDASIALTTHGPRTRTTSESGQSRCRWITFNGQTKFLSQWARELGIKRLTLRARIDKWGIEKALSAPAPASR